MAVHKRKQPVTATPSRNNSSVSSAKTRYVIRRYHYLLKEQARLSSGPSTSQSTALKDVEAEMEALGGLEAYQKMSVLGQSKERGGGSEKVLIGWLKELGVDKTVDSGNERRPLRLLEVGALRADNYERVASWIHCTPIDIHSRDPRIKEQDFLAMDMMENEGNWDIVSLSLVVNFVGKPLDRGKVLSLAHAFLSNDSPAYLFLVLPLPCVQNSRFLTFEHLSSLMGAIGFELLKQKWKQTGKVAYWLWRKSSRNANADWTKKKILLPGGGRNNFAILWDGA